MFQEEEVQIRRHLHKFCSGWVQHKTHKQHGGHSWDKLWLVLKGNIIYIFRSTDTLAENQIGNLTIDVESKFVNKGGDREKGFKFELTTGKRVNLFKTEKSAQRELWRAYVIGVSKGRVPNDIDLLDSDVNKIQTEIDAYISGTPFPNADEIYNRQSGISKSSSDESGVGASIGPQSGFSTTKCPSFSESRSSGSGSASTFVENGGPTVVPHANTGIYWGSFFPQTIRDWNVLHDSLVSSADYANDSVARFPSLVHKFYDDRSRNQTPPSWFFSRCSRQQAEVVLETGERYGNTLIRESTSYKDNGSYVISKLVRKQGAVTFEHYEVMRTAGGYKINVENPHDALRSLSQVMDYFVRTSGGLQHTKPMETNDLAMLGLQNFQDPDYIRHIQRGDNNFPDDDPVLDYEEAASQGFPPGSPRKSPLPLHSKSFGPADSRNISGILKTSNKGANSGKTVGFNSSTPQTVAGPRYARQKEFPSMNELESRHQEAAELQNLDNIIGGFESDHVYVNEEELNKLHAEPRRQRSATDVAPPPPPLPPPHPPTQSYVNVRRTDLTESATLQNLPVAPPAPRDPIPAPTTVKPIPPIPPLPVKKTHHNLSNTTPKSPGQTNLHPSQSFSPTGTNRPIASVQPTTPDSASTNKKNPFRKSHSEEQFKAPGQQIGSPSSFPSWKDNLKPVNQSPKSENITDTNEAANSENISGVEVRNPGGVNTLRCRFEKASSGNLAAALRKAVRPGGGVIWPRKTLSAILPTTTTDDVYEIMTEETESHTRWSVSSETNLTPGFYLAIETEQERIYNAKSNASNTISMSQPRKNNAVCSNDGGGVYGDVATADEFYDDTFVPGNEVLYKADTKKVQFQVNNEPQTPSRLTQRRKTEPCVSISKQEFEGLNQDFKNKLEGLFGGSQQGMGPKSPTSSRPTSQINTEDHVYEHLPADIVPDEVFYVNTKFNEQT